MAGEMPFERPLEELRKKIDELERFGEDKKIDFSDEVSRLEERYHKLEEEIYGQLSTADKIQIARHPMRPTTLDYIHELTDDFIELHGDRAFGDDLAIVGGIGTIEGQTMTLIGHQKGKDTKDNIARNFGMPHPEGFRKALRMMHQANKFNRPILTFIDTPGAYPGGAAEERGQAEAIARNLMEMARFEVPIICIVIGEGGSGGALALGVGNRILMLENAIYSVSSPEAAASILYKDASKSLKAAEAMKITADHIYALGVADDLIAEPRGGAHRNLSEQANSIKQAVQLHLSELRNLNGPQIVADRYEKFRKIGAFTTVPEATSETK